MFYEEIRDDQGLYPPESILDKCEIFTDLGDSLRLYDDAWMEIKTAK